MCHGNGQKDRKKSAFKTDFKTDFKTLWVRKTRNRATAPVDPEYFNFAAEPGEDEFSCESIADVFSCPKMENTDASPLFNSASLRQNSHVKNDLQILLKNQIKEQFQDSQPEIEDNGKLKQKQVTKCVPVTFHFFFLVHLCSAK